MRWLESLESMECSLEKEVEKNVNVNNDTKNDSVESISSVYEWQDEFLVLMKNYECFHGLEEAGFNVDEVMDMTKEKISVMINMGKTKFQITDDEINHYLEQSGFLLETNETLEYGKKV